MLLSSLLRSLVVVLASAAAWAQSDPAPSFAIEDLQKDGPGRNGVPECDDPPLRTDLDVSASQATCNTCPGGKAPEALSYTYNDTGDPVLLHNGAVSYRATDLFIPGRGVDFDLTRRYNSKRANENGVMGWGWEFAYDQRLDFDGDPSSSSRVTGRLQNGNNRVDTYVKQAGTSAFLGSTGLYTRIAQYSSTVWVLRARHGSKSYFEYAPVPERSNSYRLFMIEDASGNHMLLTYYSSGIGQGRLQKITDTLGREITFTYIQTLLGDVRLERVTDFTGREVVYGYDAAGHLTSARTPIVASTGGVNDFPSGRIERYEYFTTYPLEHYLQKVIRPRQVAANSTAAYVSFTYVQDTSWRKGWVQTQTLGSGTITYGYTTTATPPTGSVPISVRTTVTDRKGNLTHYWFNQGGQVAWKDEIVGSSVYRTKFTHNGEGEILEIVHPRGNVETRTYQAPATRFDTGNLASVTHSRGSAPDVHPGYDTITTYFTWEPVFNHLLTRTDPRNVAWKTSFVLDYMEGSASLSAPNDVAPSVATMLGIPVGTARSLLAPLVRNVDLNGDGIGGSVGTVPIRGNVIQRIEPSVSLDQTLGISTDSQMAVEGDASQEAITSWTYNQYGQVTSETDAEENISLFAYTPFDDVDADGIADVGGGAPAGTTGGLPRRTIEDTSLPYSGEFASQFTGLVARALATDIGRNKGLSPTPAPTNRTTDLLYSQRRHLVGYVDGRGVQHALSVNELGEVWKIRRGMDTAAAATRNGGAPEEPSEPYLAGGAFNYERILRRDANAKIVSVEETDSVAAPGTYWETQYEYDILDNVRFERKEKTAGVFVTTQTQYDVNENVTRVISPLGNTTEFVYDARDQLVETYLAPSGLDKVETLTYDSNGNVLTRTDGKSNVTTFEYDEFDRLHRVIDAIGNERVYTYDEASNVVQALDKMDDVGTNPAIPLRSTLTSYDERSRAWRVDRRAESGPGLLDGAIAPNDGLVSNRLDYDRLSRLTFRTEDDNKTDESHYDGLGRLVWTKDPAGNIQQGSFDDESNLVQVHATDVYPGGGTRVFWKWRRYDALGRLVSETNPLGETERYEYDARDLVVATSDAEAPGSAGQIHGVNVNPPGNTRTFVYDGRGLLTREVADLRLGGNGAGSLDLSNLANPDGQVTTQQVWDDDGRLWKRIDDNGNTTEYALDHRGRVLEERFADGTKITSLYDQNDNLDWRKDARGNESDFTFDALDRLTEVRLLTSPNTALGTTRVLFGYDGLGRRTDAISTYRTQADAIGADHTWTVTRTWDPLDRLLTETQDGKVLAYTWREEGKRTQVVYPSGVPFAVGTTYDALDRVAKIQTNGIDLAGYKYAGPDRKLERSLRNRSSTRWHNGSFNDAAYYDDAKRQTKLEHINLLTQAQLGSFEHAYNRAGVRKWERRDHDGGKGDNYAQDSLYRLTAFERRVPTADVGTLGLGNDESDRKWTLDGAHNWIKFKVDAVNYTSTVDQVHNYTDFGGVDPEYDLDGNLTMPNDLGSVVLDYDYLNRLVRVRNTQDGTAIEHVYDAEGRRVQTIFDSVPNAPLERQYVYDGWEVVEEHDLVTETPETWIFMRRYVMGIGIDEPVCMEVLPGQAGARTFYYMQSTLGNVVGLTNNNGDVVERYTYDAYGAPRFESAANVPLANQKSVYGNPYLFTGRRYEPWVLPMYEYRNRFYLPEQGRFVQRDPIGTWGDTLNLGNPLAYVGGGPTTRVDPFGLDGGASAAVLLGGATMGEGLAAAGAGALVVVTSPVTLGVLAVVSIGVGGYLLYEHLTETAASSPPSAVPMPKGIPAPHTGQPAPTAPARPVTPSAPTAPQPPQPLDPSHPLSPHNPTGTATAFYLLYWSLVCDGAISVPFTRFADHTKKRPSTREKHEEGDSRRQRDQGKEKKDDRKKWKRSTRPQDR